MYVKQKQLQSKCRSCGNINQLDSTHRAGAYLMKADLTGQSEIDQGKTDKKKGGKKGKNEEKKVEEGKEEQKEEQKVEGKEESKVMDPQSVETGLGINTAEIGKF